MKHNKTLLTIVALAGILSFMIGPLNNSFAQINQASSNQTSGNKQLLSSLSASLSNPNPNPLVKPTKTNNNNTMTTTMSNHSLSNTHPLLTKNPNLVNQTNSTLAKGKSNGFLSKIEHGFKNLFGGGSKK